MGLYQGSLYEQYCFGVIGPGFLNQVPTLRLSDASNSNLTSDRRLWGVLSRTWYVLVMGAVITGLIGCVPSFSRFLSVQRFGNPPLQVLLHLPAFHQPGSRGGMVHRHIDGPANGLEPQMCEFMFGLWRSKATCLAEGTGAFILYTTSHPGLRFNCISES